MSQCLLIFYPHKTPHFHPHTYHIPEKLGPNPDLNKAGLGHS